MLHIGSERNATLGLNDDVISTLHALLLATNEMEKI